MDEVFGAERFAGVISYAKISSASGERLSSVTDFLLWYAKNIS
jgi:adenine-specific DNA-methyltransferase